MKKLIATFAIALACVAGYAQTNAPAPSLFNKEVSLSISSGWVPNTDYSANFTVGAEWFITKNVGITAEMPFYTPEGVAVDRFSAGLKFRVPVLKLFAPYAGAGVTYNWDREDFDGYIQGGVETRINPKWGVFVETRYIYTEMGSWEGFTKGEWGVFGGIRLVLF